MTIVSGILWLVTAYVVVLLTLVVYEHRHTHKNKECDEYKHVNKSTLIGARRGDRVKCKYGNSGNKFWTSLLDKHPTVDKIQYSRSAGFCRFTFKEDDSKDNYFYENDFEKYLEQ